MILDSQLLFSDAQAITADAASTNIVDFGAGGTTFAGTTLQRDVGIGVVPLHIFAQVVTAAFATLTSLGIQIQTDDNSGFSSPTVLFTGPAIPVASLVVGYRFALPPLFRGMERYLRLFYDVTGTNATAGNITAGITLVKQENPS